MAKKILLFFIFVLAAVGIFLAGYIFSHRAGTDTLNQPALINNSLINRFTTPPEKHILPAGPFVISNEKVSSQTLSGDGKSVIYYNPQSGEVKSVPFQDSGSSTLVSKIQPAAEKISWAENKTLLTTYKNGIIYSNLGSGFSKKLDPQIHSATLSQSGSQLAYVYFDEDQGSGEIRISNPESDGYKKIITTAFENWQMQWLGESKLSLIKPPTAESQTYWLFILNTETGNLTKILDSKTSLWVRWSPDGQKLIYSYTDATNPDSALYFMDTANYEEIKLDNTSNISDCTWSMDNKTVYCANKDSFVTIDTSSDSPTPKDIQVSVGQNDIPSLAENATDLILSSSENYLIFRNLQDDKIYSLPLNR